MCAVARGEREARPVVLADPRGPQPYPVPLPGLDHSDHPSLFDAIESAADSRSVAGAALLPVALVDRLAAHVDSLRGRCTRIESELQGLPDPAEMRSIGDLLLARFHQVPQGARSVRLEGFDGVEVDVELDPESTPNENARRYYDRAARAERAAERLPDLAAEARRDWERAAELLARATEGTATAAEIEAALPQRVAGATTDGPALPYRRYRSSGGLEIRVGRGARSNDDLTFRHSAPTDVWLHARDVAGAHVILRWTGEGSPPARDLEEAAVLAALGSKARTSGSVPVDWTRRRYVRKPRKAPPGLVVPERVSTVFVEPDAAVEERLRVD
jgi:predicted ribosome quality control (RQC) complex YloA/Tae2 family protein